MHKLLLLFTVLASALLLNGEAEAAPGDLVGTVHFSQNCGSGRGVGITYDGAGHLWVSCLESNPDLLRADAVTGVVDQTYNINGGLGALAYDASRNAIWAGPGCGAAAGIHLIQLDGTKSVTGSSVQFDPGGDCNDDGLGYDAADDTLYYSPDLSVTISHYKTDGTSLGSFTWTGSACFNSGVAIGGNLLFQGSDGCSHVWVVDKTSLAPVFDFSTGVAGDPNFRDEGLTCDTQTFAALGKQVIWSKEAFSPNRASAFEIPADTCGVGGRPAAKADLGITKTASPDPAFVGDTITYTLTVTNHGPDTSSGGTVTDTLPPNVTYVSDDDGCSNAVGTVTCSTGSLANGASQVIHITVTATAVGSATNTAVVDGNDEDDDATNDTATVTSQIIPKNADLSITKSGPPFTQGGGSISYTISVSNAGPADATNVTVSDPLPVGETLVSAAASQGTCFGTVVCALGSISKGASATITIVANVTAPCGSTLTNTASVSGDQPDADPGNNSSSTSAFVYCVVAGGNFVIGDHNAGTGTAVTFWGAQWWKLNSLSGGAAPAAFKGFEKMPATVTCGTNWSTRTGNSPPPPAGPLPAFMAVIVASSISQSGSTISGDTAHIVVVKTNLGYAANPGHAGTGTVVAQLC
jgi:uncharacterized repeat protein (TIGR01451 family)